MKLGDKFATAWENLGRRKVRTALTSTGVVVGIVTVVTMISLVKGVQLQVASQFEKLGLDRVTVRPPTDSGFGGGFNPFSMGERTKLITPADVARWRKWPDATSVTPSIEMPFGMTTKLHFKDKTSSIRIVPGGANRMRPFAEPPAALAGTLETGDGPGVLVLSQGVVKNAKLSKAPYEDLIGQPATITLEAPRGEKQSFNLKIVGVSSSTGPGVQVSPADALAMKSWWFNDPDLLKNQGYDSVTLRSTDVSGAKRLVQRLCGEKWEVQSIDAIMEAANRIFGLVTAMLAMVSGITLLVACIGIANTMIMSIYERTGEIGTLKAMGASSGDIRGLFMLEAGLIGFLGGGTGLVLGFVLTRILNVVANWMAHRRHLPVPEHLFVFTPLLALQALLFAVFIGVIAGLYPASRAAKLDPLAALRHG